MQESYLRPDLVQYRRTFEEMCALVWWLPIMYWFFLHAVAFVFQKGRTGLQLLYPSLFVRDRLGAWRGGPY